jgi:integrase
VLTRPEYRTMIRLQLLTGMRPGEVVLMRACDLNTTGFCWTYTPREHKTEHHGKSRVIFLGPRAQAELRPWLEAGGPKDRHLFRPARGKRPYINRDTYAKTIAKAAKRAGVPHWHPNRLRHAAATRIRRECGLEASRVILGHSNLATTEVYAERDTERAVEVVSRLG